MSNKITKTEYVKIILPNMKKYIIPKEEIIELDFFKTLLNNEGKMNIEKIDDHIFISDTQEHFESMIRRVILKNDDYYGNVKKNTISLKEATDAICDAINDNIVPPADNTPWGSINLSEYVRGDRKRKIIHAIGSDEVYEILLYFITYNNSFDFDKYRKIYDHENILKKCIDSLGNKRTIRFNVDDINKMCNFICYILSKL